MTGRKFYRTEIRVVVLSEEPYDPVSLEQVHHDIVDGDCSGKWNVMSSGEIDGKAAAAELIAQGSDPEFFGIDENGKEI